MSSTKLFFMPLKIKTTLRESPGKGLGLFTEEDIILGQEIYFDDPLFEKVITRSDKEKMEPEAQQYIEKYAPYNKEHDLYYLNTDNARFWNHDECPNTMFVKYSPDTHLGKVIALCDIPAGTELTANYAEFCDNCRDGEYGFTMASPDEEKKIV